MRPLKNAQFRSLRLSAQGQGRRGLKSEPDAEIGEKGAFFKGLKGLYVFRSIGCKKLSGMVKSTRERPPYFERQNRWQRNYGQ